MPLARSDPAFAAVSRRPSPDIGDDDIRASVEDSQLALMTERGTDASSYVTNGRVGPTLTIMALTARACEYAAREYAAGTL